MLTKLPGIILWHHSVQGFFFKKSKIISISYVVFHTLSKFMKFISVLLPLKIILLLSSPEVPSYFSSFITIESKQYWVVGLVCATIFMYLSTFVFDAFKGAFSRRMAVIITSDESSVVESVIETEKIYSRIAKAYGDLFYFFIVFGVGLAVNAMLFASMLFCVFIEIAFFGLWVRFSKIAVYKKGETISGIWRKWGSAFPSVNFLLGFIFLLFQFAYFEFDNAFYAIVSIVALRQNFGVMKSYGDHGLWLWENKEKVYSVIDQKSNSADENDKISVVSKKMLNSFQRIQHFAPKSRRHKRFLDSVKPLFIGQDSTEIASRWIDPPRHNVLEFLYDVDFGGSGHARVFHERLDFSTDTDAIENEKKLISYSDQLALPCPDNIQFRQLDDGLVQKIQEIGEGEFAIDMSMRERALKILLVNMWSIDLKGMDSLYNKNNAYSLVDLELSKWDWKILRIVAEDQTEQSVLKDFEKNILDIKEMILDVPLGLASFNLPGSNIYIRNNGEPVIVDWKGWRPAPIGIRLNMLMEPEKFLMDIPGDFFERQTKSGKKLSPEHLMLVSRAEKIQQDLKASRYRMVITKIPDLLSSYHQLSLSLRR